MHKKYKTTKTLLCIIQETRIYKKYPYTQKKHKSRTRELTQVRARESLGIPYWKRGAPSGLGRIIYLDRLANPPKKNWKFDVILGPQTMPK